MEVQYYQSPIGILKLVSDGDTLIKVSFSETSEGIQSADRVLRDAVRQLDEYFQGDRSIFELPIRASGTDFQQRVWSKLLDIPFGSTITYLELARRLGDEKTIRAAGRANGKNPIPIVIPCHRVIGAGGKLIGYGGGIERKRWLLQHEGALLL